MVCEGQPGSQLSLLIPIQRCVLPGVEFDFYGKTLGSDPGIAGVAIPRPDHDHQDGPCHGAEGVVLDGGVLHKNEGPSR